MCTFCEEYNYCIKESNKERIVNNLRSEIKVRIIHIFYKNDYYKGNTMYSPKQLNFCPECGRQLNGGETK